MNALVALPPKTTGTAIPPNHPALMPAGAVYPARMGRSLVLPDIDFESYSEAGHVWDAVEQKWKALPYASGNKKGLGIVGAANYAMHESTEVLCLAYNLKNGQGPKRWRPGMPPPQDLIDHIVAGGLVEAWNSAFEWWLWNMCCTRLYGWPPLPLQQMRDAMAKARASALPGSLEKAGNVLQIAVRKDKRGDALLKKFSVPRNPTKSDPRTRIRLEDEPAEAENLFEYNDTDIVTEAEASAHLPDLEGEEFDFWIVDQIINRRGVHIDREALMACCEMVEQTLHVYDHELSKLTNGVVARASELAKLSGWLGAFGINMDKMDEESIDSMLEMMPPHPEGQISVPRRALEIRQRSGSASVKKVFSMRNTISKFSRIHDLFNYHGARTGRVTGEGPQPTNLPKAGPLLLLCPNCNHYHGASIASCCWCGVPVLPGRKGKLWDETPEAWEDAMGAIKSGDYAFVEQAFGDVLLTVSGCVRGLFNAAPGYRLLSSDYSSIENVVTAALAGEEWRLEMFETHGKSYEMAAAQISGIPFAEIMAYSGYDITQENWWKQKSNGLKHPLRQSLGKVSELASGFGGWLGAWKAFGADKLKKPDGTIYSERDLIDAILAWRDASPNIVEFWGGQERRGRRWGENTPELFGLEGMAIAAIMNPGVKQPVLRKDGSHTGISYIKHGHALYCELPSGRLLTYNHAALEHSSKRPDQLSIVYWGYNTNPKMGAQGWVKINTYGGRLCENVVQATARDILRRAIILLEAKGYPVVLHVYDEIVCEVPAGYGTVKELEEIMMDIPDWATYKGKKWPIKAAGGWDHCRYQKG